MADGYVLVEVNLDTKQFDKQINYIDEQMDDIEQKLEMADMGMEVGDVSKLEAQYERLQNQLKDLIKKQRDFNGAVEKVETKSLVSPVSQMNTELGKSIKKATKLAFAIVGIRSAYLGIRKIISLVRSDNAEINAQFQAMGNFMASVFEPIVKRIAQWMITLVQWTNYLLKAWFGVDTLSKSNEKAMKGAVKQAKELSKSLMGFDEMNILNDDGSTGVAGGLGADVPPFPIPEDVPVPEWLEWIVDNKDLVISGLLGIAAGLLAIKLGLGGIKALGIGLIVAGTLQLVQDMIEYLGKLDGSLENNGTSWEDFGKIVRDVGIIVLGIGIITGNLPAIIAGALITIVGLFVSNWDKIKRHIDNFFKWLDEGLSWIEDSFSVLGGIIAAPIRWAMDTIKNLFEGMFKTAKRIFDGILLIFKGDFKNGLVNIGKGVLNALIMVLNKMILGFNLVLAPVRALIVALGKVTGQSWTMSSVKIPTINYLAEGGLINNPGRGVPIGSNIVGGEAGEEAVLPLDNEHTMNRLGESIGRHIILNLTNIIDLDGKTIGKEIKKVIGEQDFLMNR